MLQSLYCTNGTGNIKIKIRITLAIKGLCGTRWAPEHLPGPHPGCGWDAPPHLGTPAWQEELSSLPLPHGSPSSSIIAASENPSPHQSKYNINHPTVPNSSSCFTSIHTVSTPLVYYSIRLWSFWSTSMWMPRGQGLCQLGLLPHTRHREEHLAPTGSRWFWWGMNDSQFCAVSWGYLAVFTLEERVTQTLAFPAFLLWSRRKIKNWWK